MVEINYRYFTNDAENDYQDAIGFFEKSDFRKAVFYSHLSLEKYLKAYFLKQQVILNPKEIGHVRYSIIVEKLMKVIQHDAENHRENKSFQQTTKIMIKYLMQHKELYKILETKEPHQIALWKQSLEIPQTKHEENLLNGITQQFLRSLGQFLIEIGEHWKNDNQTGEPLIKDKNTLKNIENEYSKFFSDISTKGITNVDPFEFLETIFKLMKPYFFGTGPNSMNIEDSDVMEKLFILLRSTKWADIATTSYCHRQISQYLTLIDGSTSEQLYNKYRKNLRTFLVNIYNSCDELKKIILD